MDLTSVTLEIWRMLEVCCVALAFLVPLKKKESRWVRRAVICIALGGLVFLGMPVVIAHFPFMACVRSAVFLVFTGVLFWQCADLSFNSIVYCAVWSTMLGDFLIECNTLLYRNLMLKPIWSAVVGMVLLLVLTGGVGCTIARWMPDKGRYHTGPRQFAFALGLWVISVLADLFWVIWNPPIEYVSDWVLLLMIKFYCITVLYLQHGLFQKSAIRQELAMMNTLWMQQKAQYDLSKENIALINRKCHDLKHQIRAMRAIFTEEQQKKYFQDIEQSVRIYDVLAKTGNEVLDTVLTEKSLVCEANGIQANCVADGRVLAFMDPVDLYTIFGNALDNAIESVSTIEDRTRRIIDVQVYSEKQMLVIQIINPITQELVFDAEDLPVTTKEQNGYHGFGLRSIRHTVKKYGGFMTVKVEDGAFYLRLLLPKIPPQTPDQVSPE